MIKFAFLSDTHGGHRQVKQIPCDVLCYTGDITNHGDPVEIQDFINWLSKYPAKAKVFIAGNHDKTFDARFCHAKAVNGDFINEYILHKYAEVKNLLSKLPPEVIYLHNSSVNLFGYNIWGSPYSPEFGPWAFSRERGEEIAKEWAKIPSDTDILLVHGPPYGILDQRVRQRVFGDHLGCVDLYNRIRKLDKLKLCAFGHVHENYGTLSFPVTGSRRVMFVNSALQKDTNKLDFVNDKPIVVYA